MIFLYTQYHKFGYNQEAIPQWSLWYINNSFVDYNGLLNGLLLLHVFQSKTKYMKV